MKVSFSSDSHIPSIMAAEYEEMMKAKGFLPHYIDCHHPELKQKAKDELGETDEIRGLALEQFRECILADEKLKNVLTDDEFLILFLRARKYNIENALSLLGNFFHTIAAHPEIFSNLDQEKIYKLAGSGFISTLPFRSSDGCFIIISKIGIWDPDEINEQVLFSLAMMLFLCAVNCPATQITGVRVIFDAEGYSFKQVRRFVPRYIPLVSKALRNCLPVRFKSIHIINESIVLRYGWSVLKVFLSEKIRNRFYIHGDSKDELLKYIQKEILPVDQGGDCANPIDGDRIIKELDKFYDRFLSMLKF